MYLHLVNGRNSELVCRSCNAPVGVYCDVRQCPIHCSHDFFTHSVYGVSSIRHVQRAESTNPPTAHARNREPFSLTTDPKAMPVSAPASSFWHVTLYLICTMHVPGYPENQSSIMCVHDTAVNQDEEEVERAAKGCRWRILYKEEGILEG